MSDFTFEVKLSVHQCHVCSIVFAIPEQYESNRRDDGKDFYCPNRHSLSYPGIKPRSELIDLLNVANEEKDSLKNHNDQLLSRLDQAEAALIENGLMKTDEKVKAPAAPPLASREDVVDPPQDEVA